MNYQQILALLQAKFAGVRKDGLAQLARMIALQVTSQEEAQALIDKLDVEKVTETVKDYRKDVDKEVSEANKTYEGNLKKKFKFVELDDPTPADDPTKKTNPDDLQAAIKAAVAEVVKPLNDEIAALRGSKISESRLQMLTEKLGSCKDETFKAKVLKDFNRMSFTDDNAFNEYLTETETDIAAFNQDLANKGLGEQGKPMFGQKTMTAFRPALLPSFKAKQRKKIPLGEKKFNLLIIYANVTSQETKRQTCNQIYLAPDCRYSGRCDD